MRTLLSIIFVIATICLLITPVGAVPNEPDTASEALAQYKALTDKVSDVNEDLLEAKVNLSKKQAQLDQADTDLINANSLLDNAETKEQAFQQRADDIMSASLQGANLSRMSALVFGDSPGDFLERSAAITALSDNTQDTIIQMTRAIDDAAIAKQMAANAQQRAKDATNKAKALVNKIKITKSALAHKASEARRLYNKLSAEERVVLAGPVDNSIFIPGPGDTGKVVEVAMAQRGLPYVWGGESPSVGFDCSGLVLYAYRAVGISLPHSSRAQATMGQPVAFGEWQPGDLLFYGSPVHHVTMYIGGGQLVHASTFGVPVKTDSAPYGGGNDYVGARRFIA